MSNPLAPPREPPSAHNTPSGTAAQPLTDPGTHRANSTVVVSSKGETTRTRPSSRIPTATTTLRSIAMGNDNPAL